MTQFASGLGTCPACITVQAGGRPTPASVLISAGRVQSMTPGQPWLGPRTVSGLPQAVPILPNCDDDETLPDLVPREFSDLAMSVMNGLYDLGDFRSSDLKKHRVLVGLCRL
jgi:hypothetical protein